MATTHHIPYRLSCRQATADADVPAGVGKGFRPQAMATAAVDLRLSPDCGSNAPENDRGRADQAGCARLVACRPSRPVLATRPWSTPNGSPFASIRRPPGRANPTCHLRHPAATVHRAYGSFAGRAPSEPIRALRIGIEPPFLLTWNRFASQRPGELQGGDDQ